MSLNLNLPRPISLVLLNALPLAGILDHHLRRSSTQDRVFGTLLGIKTETELEVKSSFGVPYEVISQGQVTIDIDHHKSLLELHLKVNPKEVVIGWSVISLLLK